MSKKVDSGCDTLQELWKVAIDCNIHRPGIGGEPGRAIGFIQCANIRDFMVVASLKCWEERGGAFPPLTIVDTKINTSTVSSDDTRSEDQNQKQKR